MSRPVLAIVGVVAVAAVGIGVGNLLTSGGTSTLPAAKVSPLAADPTGRVDHARFAYARPNNAQLRLPGLNAIGGQTPHAGPPPAFGPSYVPIGQPRTPLRPLAAVIPTAKN